MTKAEFVRRHHAQQKHGNGLSLFWIALLFGVLGANAYLARNFDAQTKQFKVFYGLALGLFLLGHFLAFVWFSRRETRKFGLRCPGCEKALIGVSAQIVIASGHCGFCGRRVISESESAIADDRES